MRQAHVIMASNGEDEWVVGVCQSNDAAELEALRLSEEDERLNFYIQPWEYTIPVDPEPWHLGAGKRASERLTPWYQFAPRYGFKQDIEDYV